MDLCVYRGACQKHRIELVRLRRNMPRLDPLSPYPKTTCERIPDPHLETTCEIIPGPYLDHQPFSGDYLEIICETIPGLYLETTCEIIPSPYLDPLSRSVSGDYL